MAQADLGGLVIRKFSEIPAQGFRRGLITDMESAREGLLRLLDGLALPSRGLPPEATVLISGDIDCEMVEGSAEVPRGEIDRRHIENAHRQAQLSPRRRSHALGSQTEKIQFYPMFYVLNSNENHKVISPLGMRASHLTVRGHLLLAPATFVTNLRQLLRSVGIQYHEFHLRSFGTSHWAVTEAEKDAGVLVLETGESVMDGVIWFEGQPIRFFSFGGGWKDFVRSIADAFHIPLGVAREVLETYGELYDTGHVGVPNKIEAVVGDQPYVIPRRNLVEVLHSVARSILEDLEKTHFRDPESGHSWLDYTHAVVLNGSFLFLKGIEALVEDLWGKQVRMPPTPPEEVLQLVREVPPGEREDFLENPGLFPLLGIALWRARERRIRPALRAATNGVGFPSRFHTWWRELLEKLKIV